ncbi:MAG TPA: hypothetical protein VN716_14735 [Vicinamibacterales bacterium]|nr:hypothetical protein [Vicinamibacterales bacterium]
MTSHFWLMVLYAFFVSLVFAVLLRDDPREQLKTGGMMLGGFIVAAYVVSWLMFPFPL